jgi:hypothetical protein
MTGFGARNLEYMRAFAEAYPDQEFVHQVVAQLPQCLRSCPRAAAMAVLKVKLMGAHALFARHQ